MAYTRVLTHCAHSLQTDRTGVPVTGVRRGAEQLARDPQVHGPKTVRCGTAAVGTAVNQLVD
jgi:hypothetical protein